MLWIMLVACGSFFIVVLRAACGILAAKICTKKSRCLLCRVLLWMSESCGLSSSFVFFCGLIDRFC